MAMNFENKPKNLPAVTRGVLWALAAIGASVIANTLIKFLGKGYGPVTVTFLRSVVGFAVLLPFALTMPQVRSIRLPKLYGIRSVLGLIAVLGLVASFVYLPLAVAITLLLSRVLLFAAIGMVLWREPARPAIWLALVVGLFGAALLISPRLEGLQALGVAAAMLAAVASSGSQTAVKAITRTEPPISVVFWFAAFVSVVLFPFNVDVLPELGARELMIAVAIALLTLVMQTTAGYCYRYLTNAAAGSLDYVSVPAAALIDWLVFSHTPSAQDAVGTVLVIGSCAVILHMHPRERG
jgi:drug/metabolite transporter (DMT)-like permease